MTRQNNKQDCVAKRDRTGKKVSNMTSLFIPTVWQLVCKSSLFRRITYNQAQKIFLCFLMVTLNKKTIQLTEHVIWYSKISHCQNFASIKFLFLKAVDYLVRSAKLQVICRRVKKLVFRFPETFSVRSTSFSEICFTLPLRKLHKRSTKQYKLEFLV